MTSPHRRVSLRVDASLLIDTLERDAVGRFTRTELETMRAWAQAPARSLSDLRNLVLMLGAELRLRAEIQAVRQYAADIASEQVHDAIVDLADMVQQFEWPAFGGVAVFRIDGLDQEEC